jgi:hypothetical protein
LWDFLNINSSKVNLISRNQQKMLDECAQNCTIIIPVADVAELADALASGASGG